MRIFRRAGPRSTGSVLLITLFIALGLGMVLASYLLLIRSQYVSVVRSQAWHSALTLAEAGVEEAMAQLNSTAVTNAAPTGNGWVLVDGLYQPEDPRTLLDGQYRAAYTQTLPPTIYATGYATVPTLSARIERAVEVKTAWAPMFSVGAAVRGAIQMNSKSFFSDSFDSTSLYYSGLGGTYDLSVARANGDIGSVGGILNSSGVAIHGRVFLGAAATNSWESYDAVSGATRRDFNADFPEAQPPFEYCDRPPLTGGTNFTYLLQGHAYMTNDLNGSLFVTNDVDAVLYVTGDVNISTLIIAPGASLRLYVGGGNTRLGVVLVSGTATNFQYYGLAGNTNLTMTGSNLTATVYAPNARFWGGEGSTGDPFSLCGAIVADSIDMQSDLKIHFDESLKAAAANGRLARGFVIASWQELPLP